MKRVAKKVPLFRISAKKDTLISDLLSSEPHSEKSTLFWESSDKQGNTIRKSGTPGYQTPPTGVKPLFPIPQSVHR